MKNIECIIVGAIGALFLCAGINPSVCKGEESQSFALMEFAKFIKGRESVLSRLRAFEMKGRIAVEVSEEFLKINGGSKRMQRNFTVEGNGLQTKAVVDYMDIEGRIRNSMAYHLDSERVVVVDGAGERRAKIFSLSKGEDYGLFNHSPAFLEYSFLHQSISRAGIPTLTLGKLAEKEIWLKALKNVQSAEIADDGILSVTIASETGSCMVELRAKSDKDGYQIGAVTFFTKDGLVDRKIEVLSFQEDENGGKLGNRFRVSVYFPIANSPPAAVWDFDLDGIKINNPIDADALDFDPLSVVGIFDGDNNVNLSVPK